MHARMPDEIKNTAQHIAQRTINRSAIQLPQTKAITLPSFIYSFPASPEPSCMRRSTEEARSLCAAAEACHARLRQDMVSDELLLRTWLAGLERIGDVNQLAAVLLLSLNGVTPRSLKLLAVDDLAAFGIPKPVACELIAQFSCRERHDMQSAHVLRFLADPASRRLHRP
jgi:hypothetical protein